MDESKKKILMIAIIVVCIALAIVITLATRQDAAEEHGTEDRGQKTENGGQMREGTDASARGTRDIKN